MAPPWQDLIVKRSGTEYLIRVERAPRPGPFISTLRRSWALITRDRSWWLTVSRSDVPWIVLRERFWSEGEAVARADDLARALRSGAEEVGRGVAWRWRDHR
jgi:hypothetical protein